ncbi:PLDc N-terminal domain-containing protein [Microtetraspora sp. AC03309]|uniref:PLDc N-terminal domain-containing protein n=1 Tax=Microtetraspora sp. AC03309 TaxID=2779376 RepID=UPI001E5F8B4D|nr:PLDc N-terminal domain-containing protein [Microtetraspora sp. AC03309]MCC5576658.1 PLDc N-terminal domain-containing protein [Microtetraspora sp. AC03309]
MPSVILGLALLAFWLYCLFDVITTPEGAVRNLPKLLWVLVVLFLAAVGGVFWLALGRPRSGDAVLETAGTREGPDEREAWQRPPRAEAPRGPDDDPEFLRALERRLRNED